MKEQNILCIDCKIPTVLAPEGHFVCPQCGLIAKDRKYIRSKPMNNEKIQTRGYTPIDEKFLNNWASVNTFLRDLEAIELKSLDEFVSIKTALGWLRDISFLIKRLFESNNSLFLEPWKNPNRKVGETESDGTIKSITIPIPPERILISKEMREVTDLIYLTTCALKDNILSDDLPRKIQALFTIQGLPEDRIKRAQGKIPLEPLPGRTVKETAKFLKVSIDSDGYITGFTAKALELDTIIDQDKELADYMFSKMKKKFLSSQEYKTMLKSVRQKSKTQKTKSGKKSSSQSRNLRKKKTRK